MHITASPSQSTSLVRAAMEFLLSKLVNQHTKRIIFVTSLYTRVSRLTLLEQSAVVKLNQLMVLATNENSLSFTSRLQSLVWGQTAVNDMLSLEALRGELTDARCRELSTRVVDMSPKWLRYGKPNMIRDVVNLLRQSPQLSTFQSTPATA